jgi:hypothetical protein
MAAGETDFAFASFEPRFRIGVSSDGYESDVKSSNSETFCLGIASNWGMVQITPELLVGSGGARCANGFYH